MPKFSYIKSNPYSMYLRLINTEEMFELINESLSPINEGITKSIAFIDKSYSESKEYGEVVLLVI